MSETISTATADLASLATRYCNIDIDVTSFEALATNSAANTKLSYIYRDANNNKTGTSVVMSGVLTPKEITQILAHLDESSYFIPGLTGLQDLQGNFSDEWDEEQDHPYHELTAVELTIEPAGHHCSAHDFVAIFTRAEWEDSYRPDP